MANHNQTKTLDSIYCNFPNRDLHELFTHTVVIPADISASLLYLWIQNSSRFNSTKNHIWVTRYNLMLTRKVQQ